MSKIITEVEALDIMSQLGKELVTAYEAEDATIANIVDALLAFQVLPEASRIIVGTISGDYSALTRSIKVDGDTVLRALFRLRDTVGGYLYVDNDRQLQWASSLGEDKGQQIRYRKNLKGIERDIDYDSLANRLYCYGAGEGTARIKLSDVESLLTGNAASGQKVVAVIDGTKFEEGIAVTISDDDATEDNTIATIAGNNLTMTTNLANTYTTAANAKVNRGEDFIEDTTSQGAPPGGWGGVYVGVKIDKSITHPDTLLAWALLRLAETKNPSITYSVDTVDLSKFDPGFDFDALLLGSTVKVIDEDLGIDVSVKVVKIEHPNLSHPEQMVLELATRIKDIADSLLEVYDRQQFDHHVATTIGAGNVIVKGTFTVLDWATGGETTIDGSNIETGTVTLSMLNFVALTSSGGTGEVIATINATAEGIKISADKIEIGAGVTIFKQDGIPTSTRVGDLWFDTNDANKLYRAASVDADEITEGEWELVRDTLMSTNAASIVVTEEDIALNVTAISNNAGDIVTNTGNITINADAITLEVTNRTNADSTLSGLITVNADAITLEVTNRTNADSTLQGNITVNADNIALKVSKDDVINSINISIEGIKIDADNITLDGVVDVTDDLKSSNYSVGVSGWIIDGDGSAEFNNVTVRGNIQAGEYSSISAGYLTGGTITGETIILSGVSSILKSSNFAWGSAGWQIRGDGDAEFNDVTVRGKLIAQADSEISGVYISEGTITADRIVSVTYAQITSVEIDNADIVDVSADKITAGTITSEIIVISGEYGTIESSNYDYGVSGWQIIGDGSAEFNNVTVRGRLIAQADSEISGVYIEEGTITADRIVSVTYAQITSVEIENADIVSVSADKITAGTITAETIILSGAFAILESSDYDAGVAGWQIKGDGDAEFNEVTVRGAVYASSGEFTGTLKASNIEAGKTLTVNGAISAGAGALLLDTDGITAFNAHYMVKDSGGTVVLALGFGGFLGVNAGLATDQGEDLFIRTFKGAGSIAGDIEIKAGTGSVGCTAKVTIAAGEDIYIDPDLTGSHGVVYPVNSGYPSLGTNDQYWNNIYCCYLKDTCSPVRQSANPLEALRKMNTRRVRLSLEDADKKAMGGQLREKIIDAGGVLELDDTDKSTFPDEILEYPSQKDIDHYIPLYEKQMEDFRQGKRSIRPAEPRTEPSTDVFAEIWFMIRAIQRLADKVDILDAKIH